MLQARSTDAGKHDCPKGFPSLNSSEQTEKPLTVFVDFSLKITLHFKKVTVKALWMHRSIVGRLPECPAPD